MTEPARQHFTFPEYLMLEEASRSRHEFLAGHVWAMAGGTIEHAAVCANISTWLGVQLRTRRCRVFSPDLRVRVRATGLGTYPDVTVVCGRVEVDAEDPKRQTVVNPTLTVEVLSPSTEAYDRGEKLAHYRTMDSLREVVLVAHDKRHVEVWRNSGGEWLHTEYTGEESAALESIGCELPLAEVYRDPLADGAPPVER